eukprot:249751-Hanusia_phi.AAC.1
MCSRSPPFSFKLLSQGGYPPGGTCRCAAHNPRRAAGSRKRWQPGRAAQRGPAAGCQAAALRQRPGLAQYYGISPPTRPGTVTGTGPYGPVRSVQLRPGRLKIGGRAVTPGPRPRRRGRAALGRAATVTSTVTVTGRASDSACQSLSASAALPSGTVTVCR